MLDPHRMIVINLMASLILMLSLAFYRYIYPKRNIRLFFLLILISILPIISIFRTGAYESGDFNIHIYRTMDLYKSLSEGIAMPSWAGNLNATYGYPLFIFNYTLPYYIISLFHWIGFPHIGSLKIFLALNVILPGIFMFLFTKKIFKNDLPAFAASTFYVFAPYHLIDVHFKVVIGEILFFTILPLTFLFAYELRNKRTLLPIFLFALSFAALIMSHLVIAFFAGALILFYTFSNSPKNNLRQSFLCTMAGFGISLIISSYQWLGPLLLSQYSFIQNITLGTAYFPTLQDLLYAPWGMGLLFQGPNGEISHLLGYVHLFVIISLLVLLCKKKVPKKIFPEVLFWLMTFFITIFLILPYSKFLWESLPIIKVVGSHRLLILASFTSSILAGYFALIIRKQWVIYFLVAIAIGSTILNWGQRRVIPEIADAALQKNIAKSTSEGEGHFYANTKWVDIDNPWFSELPKQHLEKLQGNAIIKELERTSIEHFYFVNAKTPIVIKENTLHFPGWTLKSNNKNIAIYPDQKGIINAKLPQGVQYVELSYDDLPLYKYSKVISVGSLFAFLILIIFTTIWQKRST